MKFIYIKPIIISCILLLFYSTVNASQLKYFKYLDRPDFEYSFLNNPTTEITLQDPIYWENQDNSLYYRVNRDVFVHLIYGREDRSDVVGNYFKYRIEYDLLFPNSSESPQSGELEIEFNEETGVYEAVGEHLGLNADAITAQLVITRICGDYTGDGTYNELCLNEGGVTDLGINADDIRIELEMRVDKFYHLHYLYEIPLLDAVAEYNDDENQGELKSQVKIYWSYRRGFEEYELEYVYWDAKATDKPDPQDNDYEEKLFENAIRITTWRNNFTLDANYPEGELYFRVRGVGVFIRDVGTDYTYKKYGQWSPINPYYNPTLQPIEINNNATLKPFESDKNWQFTTTFAEDGKNKSVLSYHDGSLRNRQLLTNLSDAEVTLVAETDYSIEGQGVLSILPAPTSMKENNFFFKPGFNQNSNNEPYSYLDFDKVNGADPISTASGAGKYFSPDNNFGDIHNNYIPDAFGYPLTQARYRRDATGRMDAQGGVGEFYKLGSNRETKYYYLTATSTELHRLFGSNVGNPDHYKKNLVVDPNGQISTSYIDQTGRVIATALMGEVPENVVSLGNGFQTTVQDLKVRDNDDGLFSRSVNTIFNARPDTEYKFTYLLEGVYNAIGTYCETCEYELSITVLDEDGNVMLPSPFIESFPITQTNCTQPGNYYEDPIDYVITLAEIGEYQVIKELRVISGGLDIDNLYEYLKGTGFITLDPQDYIDEYVDNIDFTECEWIWSCYGYCLELAKTENPIWFFENGDVDPNYQTQFDNYINACTPDCEETYLETILPEVAEGECGSTLQQMKAQISLGGYSFPDQPVPPSTQTDPNDTNVEAYELANVAALKAELENPSNPLIDPPIFEVIDKNGLIYEIESGGAITPPAGAPSSLEVENYSTGVSAVVQDWDKFFYFFLFIDGYWQDQWAESLVLVHREYCLYEQCIDLNTNEVTTPSSYDYDVDLHLAETWLDMDPSYAFDINLATNLAQQDPINSSSIWCNPQQQSFVTYITSVLDNYVYSSPPTKPLYQIISGTGNDDLNIQDPELQWQIFRSVYLSVKQQGLWECSCAQNITEDEHRIFTNPGALNFDDNAAAVAWGEPEIDAFCDDFCDGQVEHWIQQINNFLVENNCNPSVLDPVNHEPTVRTMLADYCTDHCGESGTNTILVEIDEDDLVVPGGDLENVVNYLSTNGYCANIMDDLIPEESLYDDWQQQIDPCFYVILDAIENNVLPNCPNNGVYNATTQDELECFSTLTVENDVIAVTSQLLGCDGANGDEIYFIFVDENGVQIVPHCLGMEFGDITPAALPPGASGWESQYTGLSVVLEFSGGDQTGYLIDRSECGDYGSPFTIDINEMIENCEDEMIATATTLALNAWQTDVDALISTYYNSLDNCIENANEFFWVEYDNAEYHYTLYYYDQAGNLVQTIPPDGVQPVPDIYFDRGIWQGVEPGHTQPTSYKYNSLEQVKEQTSLDGGTTKFRYDHAQRLRFSQNDKQLSEGGSDTYSYTKYDAESRIVEVGQIEDADEVFGAWSLDQLNSTDYPDNTDGTLVDVTITEYTTPSNIDGGFPQENLRGRVAVTTNDDILTRYSYDVHGNVKSMRHQIDDLGKKDIDYEYDLISGNVKSVALEDGELDQFYHQYEYDADNRLTHVYTSEDGVIWENDARYFYHAHGQLARMEVGNDKVQGMDYYYTLQGWIKGVNQPGGNSWSYEMGLDGNPVSTNLNQWIGRDEYSYALMYHEEDYDPIGGASAVLGMADPNIVWGTAGNDTDIKNHVLGNTSPVGLFNGNIAAMITDIKSFHVVGLEGLQAMSYRYDQLHRIVEARSHDTKNGSQWGESWHQNNKYNSDYSYDGNGNLQTLYRQGPLDQFPLTIMDDLTYHYDNAIPNRLNYVTDNVPSGTHTEDFDGHTSSTNYDYDGIGNIIKDDSEYIQEIKWNVYGKVDAVIYSAIGIAAGREHIYYKYDAAGNRMEKKVNNEYTLYYLRDASGNIMAVYRSAYEPDPRDLEFYQNEVPLYGSSRIGQRMFSDRQINIEQYPPDPRRIRGEKAYELSNHLGNVLVTTSDQKLGEDGDSNIEADFYATNIRSASDYYPFGMAMPLRTSNAPDYRYGFNGMEEDNEMIGSGISYTSYFRQYDPRIGRWLSVDPEAPSYANQSPYNFSLNSPLMYNDPNGDCPTNDCDDYNTFTGGGKVSIPSNSTGVITYAGSDLYGFTYNGEEYFWNSDQGGYSTLDGQLYVDDANPLSGFAPRYVAAAYKKASELQSNGHKDALVVIYSDVAGNDVASAEYNYHAVGDNVGVHHYSFYKKDYPEVGAAESAIPVWGSSKMAYYNFIDGEWYWGVFNLTLAASDVFLAKSIVTGIGKSSIKTGSHTWGATRAWLRKHGAPKGSSYHHWAIERNGRFVKYFEKNYGINRNFWNSLINQKWNLIRFKNHALHMRLAHGKKYLGKAGASFPVQMWYNNPHWLKATIYSTSGRLLPGRNTKEGVGLRVPGP